MTEPIQESKNPAFENYLSDVLEGSTLKANPSSETDRPSFEIAIAQKAERLAWQDDYNCCNEREKLQQLSKALNSDPAKAIITEALKRSSTPGVAQVDRALKDLAQKREDLLQGTKGYLFGQTRWFGVDRKGDKEKEISKKLDPIRKKAEPYRRHVRAALRLIEGVLKTSPYSRSELKTLQETVKIFKNIGRVRYDFGGNRYAAAEKERIDLHPEDIRTQATKVHEAIKTAIKNTAT